MNCNSLNDSRSGNSTVDNQGYTTLTLKKEILESTKGEYVLWGDFEGMSTVTKILHISCGQPIEVTPTEFMQGTRCTRCQPEREDVQKRKDSQRQLEDAILEQAGAGFCLISQYQTMQKPITIFHDVCQKFFIMTPEQFLNETPYCPHCQSR